MSGDHRQTAKRILKPVLRPPLVRLRRLLGVPDAAAADRRLDRLEAEVGALHHAAAAAGPGSGPAAGELRSVTDAHAAALSAHGQWLADLERWVTSCVKTLSTLGSQPLGGGPTERVEPLDVNAALRSHIEVGTVMDWVRHLPEVPEDRLISVVTATRNRPRLLRQAVASVLAQSYPRFEIVVVDDGDAEDGPGSAAEALSVFSDERIRVVRTAARRGAAAAFNAGLDAVTGDVITALDDDNLMHPDWLRSLAWAFATFTDVDVVYGARTIEDKGARDGVGSMSMPMLEFFPYVRRKHERANYIDRNVLAYRSGLADLRYDEQLPSAIDWDHSLRMFRRAEPLPLPVVACYYRTVVEHRVTDEPGARDGVRIVRTRAFTGRPMRVLVHTAMYPVISETYIADDIDALRDCGADVQVTATMEAVSWTEGASSPRLDVDTVISDFAPDVALLHWSTHAEGQLPMMERHGLPFACRVHSFDTDPDRVKRLLDHPLCVAVFAHETDLALLPDGVVGLMPMVGPGHEIPSGPAARSGVVSVSAGLPKKDFPTLIEAMAALPDIERTIVVGRSNGFESVPDEVVAMAAAADPAIRVAVNMPRSEVLDLVARSSVLLYTLAPDGSMGMPMSIVEAMLAGTLVVCADRPAAHQMLGPDVRVYATADDIACQVREIEAGGPEVEAARRRLQARAERYRDPAQARRIHDVLSARITARLEAL
ncbi:MAG TPA: glycosyltransferase, partial [Acidimicrobiales bacterium]|nr:glycosyltransferase [Acidimicrobiales bacterium]